VRGQLHGMADQPDILVVRQIAIIIAERNRPACCQFGLQPLEIAQEVFEFRRPPRRVQMVSTWTELFL